MPFLNDRKNKNNITKKVLTFLKLSEHKQNYSNNDYIQAVTALTFRM